MCETFVRHEAGDFQTENSPPVFCCYVLDWTLRSKREGGSFVLILVGAALF